MRFDMKKTLLILGAGSLQIPAIRTAKRMGLRAVVLDGNPAAPGLVLGDVVRVVNIADDRACLAVAREEEVAGVIHTCCEVAMLALGRINDELGLHGVGLATAVRATNKEKMRRAFEVGGAPSPRSIGADNQEDALSAADSLPWPIIVKPSRNSGSRGVTRLTDPRDRQAICAAFSRAINCSRDHGVVIEEFVNGPEFSIEILVYGGVAHVLAVTDKRTTGAPFFVETGHSQPTQLNGTDLQEVMKAAVQGVQALGIDWSAAHAEVRLTPRGPVLMEIGARLGGDFITSELVPLSTGIDMVAGAISLALGEEPDLTRTQHTAPGAAIRYITPRSGVIRAISGLERARAMPGVRAVEVDRSVGSLVPEMTSSLCRVGHVIAVGVTAQLAIARAEAARDAVQILTDPTERVCPLENGGLRIGSEPDCECEWKEECKLRFVEGACDGTAEN